MSAEGAFPFCDCCQCSTVKENKTVGVLGRVDSSGATVTWRVASGSKLQENHKLQSKLCDNLAKRTSSVVAYLAIELKTALGDVKHAVEQLQRGVELMSPGKTDQLAVVLIHYGPVGTHELRVLSRLVVKANGRRYPIQRMKSSIDLALVATSTGL